MDGLGGSYIARLIIKNYKAVGEECLLKGKGEHLRALAEGKDGALYTVTNNRKLYRIGKNNLNFRYGFSFKLIYADASFTA